ncbi:hypothetical protein CALVIDRAFT_533323 [Calocera viscosa TUFC12733]|uniref:NTF2-like protein n=1 Tax=Calocera viscosa (strain TUFC12733) TaxID=1330018 RepID=A0A167RKP1_CALVF|nr:hypothetical protein CALVIDRAFT_533323 [Calocera viscosa TUFC12733]
MPSMTADQVKAEFGVPIAINAIPHKLTATEKANIKTVLAYMDVAYSSEKNTGADSVTQFCAPKTSFAAPSTFPGVKTVDGYAESHSKILHSLPDLHIKQFDVVLAKENYVSLRYSAEGTHIGEPHNGIDPTQQHADWTAQGIFFMTDDHKIAHWYKDWDKMQMWSKLGWVKPKDAEFA